MICLFCVLKRCETGRFLIGYRGRGGAAGRRGVPAHTAPRWQKSDSPLRANVDDAYKGVYKRHIVAFVSEKPAGWRREGRIFTQDKRFTARRARGRSSAAAVLYWS